MFDGGYLFIKTENPYFYPGNLVQGKIHVRITSQMNATGLDMNINGMEIAKFIRRVRKSTGSGKNRKHKTVIYHERYTKPQMNYSARVFTFAEPLMPGDYEFTFEFTLPPVLPASIIYHNMGHHDRPEADIQYWIEATIENQDQSCLYYKQMLVIHEQPVQFLQHAELNQTFSA